MKRNKDNEYSHTCKQCSHTFYTKYPWKNRKFCNKDCFNMSLTGRPPEQHFSYRDASLVKKCLICTKPFKTFKSLLKKGSGKFCSQKCSQVFHSGENHHAWKGGKHISSDGYVMIHSPNHPNKDVRNSVREHRLIVEKSLGRYLTSEEVIHHINEIKDDNRIKNLYLFSSEREHRKHHQTKPKEKIKSNISLS